MALVNDTDNDEDYAVQGSGASPASSSGTLLLHSVDSADFTGTGPWTVTFRGDPNLQVTVTAADYGAMLYKSGGEFAVRILQPNA